MYNSKNLTMRDPALAALVGATIASDFGADAHEVPSGFAPSGYAPETSGFASSNESLFAGEFGWDAVGAEFGAEGFFGDDFCGEGFFGADAPVTSAPKPTEQQALALWKSTHAKMQKQNRRSSMLNPNQGLSVKIERYQLNMAQSFTLGTATAINITKQPDTEIRPQRVLCNAPAPAFALFSELKVANVAVTQGDSADGWFWNANGWGVQLDLPTLSPANRVTALGVTTTLVPAGFVAGASFPLTLSFTGPASMAA